jgi:hypothetical protein
MIASKSPARAFPVRNPGRAFYFLFCLTFLPASGWAQNACDLNSDGVVDQTDVDLAKNMILTPSSCSANIVGEGVCNVVVLQRVINARGLGSTGCTLGSPHWVSLGWAASSTPGVQYNVYRGTTLGGPYSLLNPKPLSLTSYNDTGAQLGVTYYYVIKAVDGSGNLSAPSNEAAAVVPST